MTVPAPRSGWLKRRAEVEANPEGEDYLGQWYTATVKRTDAKEGARAEVEYEELVESEEPPVKLVEWLPIARLRPKAASAYPPTTAAGATSSAAAASSSSSASAQAGPVAPCTPDEWLSALPRGAPVELFRDDAWWAGCLLGPADEAAAAHPDTGLCDSVRQEGDQIYMVRWANFATLPPVVVPTSCLRPLWEYNATQEEWTLKQELYDAPED